MADISAWSPVDESNTTAPPAGAPENMPTNTVNNTMRAMMGAVRRWYDTVTAQLATVTTQLAGFLPLSGGALSGPLYSSSNLTVAGTVNSGAYQCGAIALISQGGAQRVIYDTGGTSNIAMYTTGQNYYDNSDHYFRSRLGGATTAIFSGGVTFNVYGSWATISDEAAKSDIAPYSRGLAAIRQLRPVSYRYSSGPFKGPEVHYGLIAQDMQTVAPEMVSEVDLGGERLLATHPGHLVWLLVNSCRELAARLESLETRGE